MLSRSFPRFLFIAGIARRFVKEDIEDTSASLAFTTLLALVPLVGVLTSIVANIPCSPSIVAQIELHLARSLFAALIALWSVVIGVGGVATSYAAVTRSLGFLGEPHGSSASC